jgi:hypothetical protein
MESSAGWKITLEKRHSPRGNTLMLDSVLLTVKEPDELYSPSPDEKPEIVEGGTISLVLSGDEASLLEDLLKAVR